MGAVLAVIGTVLKWIGILLLWILGILLGILLLLLILLAIPIRVRAEGEYKEKQLDARLQADYLGALVRLTADIEKSRLRWQLKICGRRIGQAPDDGKAEEKVEEKTGNEPETPKSEPISQERTEERQTAPTKAIPSTTDQPSKVEKEEKAESSPAQTEEIQPISPISPIGPGRLEGLWEKIGGMLAKTERIWYEYKSYPRKHEILQAVWKAVRRFLHSLRLRDSVLRIRYGLENPADTGYITAIGAIVGQYFDNRGCRFELEPEFQEPCLEVQGKLRLHINILQCAWIGCVLVLNQDVRRLIIYILHRKK